MSDRATCWSVTINNPVESDDECIARARQKGWKVEGQPECVTVPHYQLMVTTPQVRFSAIKKAFPRAHIEICRNKKALQLYVHKEDTRTGELPKTDSKFPSQQAFYKLLVKELFDLDDKTYRVNFDGGWYIDSNIEQGQRLLDAYDQATQQLIRKGFHVENIAVNPQSRAAWKRFGRSIIYRTIDEIDVDRESQTDRQAELLSHDNSTNGEDSEESSGQDSQGSEDTGGSNPRHTGGGDSEEDSGTESDDGTEDGSETTSQE